MGAEYEGDCPYCGGVVESTTGEHLYPHRKDLWRKRFFVCWPCDAYVGCHAKTGEPFGTLADAETRQARGWAHKAIDKLWGKGKLKRETVYAWLAREMHLPRSETHIGLFGPKQCRRVCSLVARNPPRRPDRKRGRGRKAQERAAAARYDYTAENGKVFSLPKWMTPQLGEVCPF